jgi:hypothetical protein
VTARALRAIVGARLHVERRSIIYACIVSAVFGYTNALDPAVSLPMLYCGILGIAWALAQGPGRHSYLDASERSAPLFGRELARAKALPPVACALATALVYWIAQYPRGAALPAGDLVPVLATTIAATLVALNATVRSGAARAGICALAGAVIAVGATIATTKNGGPAWAAVELCFCAVTGFVALRQYGELLARYDPLDLTPETPPATPRVSPTSDD